MQLQMQEWRPKISTKHKNSCYVQNKRNKNLQKFENDSLRCHQKYFFIIIGPPEMPPTITVKICEESRSKNVNGHKKVKPKSENRHSNLSF